MMTPEELAAYMEAVRWAVWAKVDQRRAGTLGRAVALLGTDSAGQPVELRRSGENWRLIESSGNSVDIESTEVIRQAGDGSIRLTGAKVQHDLPALLYQAAVEAAQESLLESETADRGTGLGDEGDPESGAAFEFVMALSAQDAAVRASIAAITLAVASAEAQVNAWADERGGWTVVGRDDEDKLCLVT